jgi:hypothetical protein
MLLEAQSKAKNNSKGTLPYDNAKALCSTTNYVLRVATVVPSSRIHGRQLCPMIIFGVSLVTSIEVITVSLAAVQSAANAPRPVPSTNHQ